MQVEKVEQYGQDNRIKDLIAGFILTYNYWGYLFSRILRKPSNDIPSIMGVAAEQNGTISLYYNPYLISKTEDKEILKVLEHEGMHLLNKHIPRLIRILNDEVNEDIKKLKIEIWNQASDCAVNEQAKITKDIIINGEPWPPLLPQQFNLEPNNPTEYYFYELLKRRKNNPENKKNGEGQGEGQEQNGNGDNQDKGYNSGKSFDDHSEWSNNLSEVADQNSLARKLENYVQNIVKDSVTSFNKDRGNLPAHVSDLIQDLLAPPQVPYYQIIKKLIKGTRFSKFLRSPTKINRKRTYVFSLNDIPQISPFPGKTRDMSFNIVILLDTSGSMSKDDIAEGLSGIKNIIEKDRHCKVTVLEVDAGVEKEYEVKRIRDIQFNVKGRGGTRLFPGLVRARQLNCDVCLAFTDGFVEDLNSKAKREMPKKIIWVINKNGTSKKLNRTGRIVQLNN